MIQYISKPFKWFFKLEAASGLVLLFAAIIALLISNSDLSTAYFDILNSYLKLGFGAFSLKLSVLHWINDVLMAIFFFLVSLEIKREFIQGELSNPKQAMLPIIAAVGGMVVPALIYVAINFKDAETLNGWAIPSATDIAFFYSGSVKTTYLLLMLAAIVVLIILNKFNVRNFIPYLIVGIFLWEFTHVSGIHATIAGVLLALTIPHKSNKKKHTNSLLLKLEHAISPYVAFGIMPIFAFANAGVSLEGLTFQSLLNPVPLGILCGLFFGKQIGVFIFSYLSIKLKFAEMPNNSDWLKLYGVGVLTGIGFTMSLFVGNLAFVGAENHMDGVKIGVLLGSLLSTIFGYSLIFFGSKK